MISPVRSFCFNDDRQTFTVVLPSHYQIFRSDPFGMIFSRDCDDRSLGTVATFSGYRFIALTGAPSSTTFSSKMVQVFDHQTGQDVFEQVFPKHILAVSLGREVIVCAMHCQIEVWNTHLKQAMHVFNTCPNVHMPLALSRDANNLITAASKEKQVALHKGIGLTLKSASFAGGDGPISLVRFSDDRSIFATAGFSGASLRIFDFATVACVALLDRGGDDNVMLSMDFSPNCSHLATVSKNGIVAVYDIRGRGPNPPKALLSPVCAMPIAQEVTMPRIMWLSGAFIGVITLEGDFYRLAFGGTSFEKEKTPFLKRLD